jgi:5-methylthioadenosine/S-adenosylhomocysteine deaminase
MSAERALELATLGSAAALGLDHEVGSLEPGKQADVAVVSLEGSPYVPWEDPAAAVVMGGSASRVLLTVVGGEVRYDAENQRWHELRQKGIEARAKLLGR